ncbi:MAG: AzlD domain-containing protein, partial [Chloroflexota bacterium]|nr:AzlD domain-containing protein [Chloroflexota bacterium]
MPPEALDSPRQWVPLDLLTAAQVALKVASHLLYGVPIVVHQRLEQPGALLVAGLLCILDVFL